MRHRKKSHHRRSHRRRRGVGAVNVKSLAMKVASVAAGAFVGRTIQNMATKNLTTVSPKMIALGTIIIGGFVPKFIKSEFGQGLGDGILAVGAMSGLQSFGVISGVGYIPRVPAKFNGYNSSAKAFGAYSSNVPAVGYKPYLRESVSGMPNAERELMMGALLYDE